MTKLVFQILTLSVLSGLLYRMGGSSKFNSKWRDWGCSLTFLGTLALVLPQRFEGFSLSLLARFWGLGLLLFVLLWGALSTYWKFNKTDCKWYHWGFHGLGVGLSSIPLLWINVSLIGIFLRTIILSILFILWSENYDDVYMEEFGRGFFIIATLPILLI